MPSTTPTSSRCCRGALIGSLNPSNHGFYHFTQSRLGLGVSSPQIARVFTDSN
jgi:predicted AlkP superfamily phosphohydrolase/phosphomutase